MPSNNHFDNRDVYKVFWQLLFHSQGSSNLGRNILDQGAVYARLTDFQVACACCISLPSHVPGLVNDCGRNLCVQMIRLCESVPNYLNCHKRKFDEYAVQSQIECCMRAFTFANSKPDSLGLILQWEACCSMADSYQRM